MGVGCGLPAWIGETEQCEGGSPARRRWLCKQGVKVSTWKGRGKRGNVSFVKGEVRGGRYFRGSRKFGIASDKKLARKVSSHTVPYSDMVRRYFVLHLTQLVIINCVGST